MAQIVDARGQAKTDFETRMREIMSEREVRSMRHTHHQERRLFNRLLSRGYEGRSLKCVMAVVLALKFIFHQDVTKVLLLMKVEDFAAFYNISWDLSRLIESTESLWIDWLLANRCSDYPVWGLVSHTDHPLFDASQYGFSEPGVFLVWLLINKRLKRHLLSEDRRMRETISVVYHYMKCVICETVFYPEDYVEAGEIPQENRTLYLKYPPGTSLAPVEFHEYFARHFGPNVLERIDYGPEFDTLIFTTTEVIPLILGPSVVDLNPASRRRLFGYVLEEAQINTVDFAPVDFPGTNLTINCKTVRASNIRPN